MPRTHWIIWRERGVFILISLAVIYFDMLPVGATGGNPLLPDLLYCICAAWVMRRPDSAPVALVAGVSLLSDLLLGRPPGLWSIPMVLGTEYLRGQETGKGMQMRLLEWLTVSVVFAIMLLTFRLLLAVSLAAGPSAGDLFRQLASTAVAYPPTVAILYWIVRVRSPLPADRVRAMGRV